MNLHSLVPRVIVSDLESLSSELLYLFIVQSKHSRGWYYVFSLTLSFYISHYPQSLFRLPSPQGPHEAGSSLWRVYLRDFERCVTKFLGHSPYQLEWRRAFDFYSFVSGVFIRYLVSTLTEFLDDLLPSLETQESEAREYIDTLVLPLQVSNNSTNIAHFH